MKSDLLLLPSNKKFGIFFTLVFFILSIWFFYKGYVILSSIFLFFSFLFFLLSLTKPFLLQPLNKFWMNFGLILGKIISPIVLGIVFFLLITPVACLIRIFGRDELQLDMTSKNSYWINRKMLKYSKSFKNQF